jgi:hypothetical protein
MEEGVREKVETTIDKLVDFVQKKGKVSMQEAAKTLALEVNQLEELADVLQEGGLIEVKYGITGAFLISKRINKEQAKENVKKIKENEDKIKVLANVIAKYLWDSEKSFEFIDENIEKRLIRNEEMIASLERDIKGASVADMEYLIKEAMELEKIGEKFDEEVRRLRDRIVAFNTKTKELEVEARKAEEERLGPQKPPTLSQKIKKMFGR